MEKHKSEIENQNALDTLHPGDTLDKFEVIEQIGAGGMSIVWKGRDHLLNRSVAIKQIAPDLWSTMDGKELDQFRMRFRREADLQRNASIVDKHLVRLLDFIEDSRGLFIVTEFVDGPSLEQLLSQMRGPMDTRQALGIVGATAKALEIVHKHSMVHLDLKPSNILLPRSGGLKVGDFGLATLIAEQDSLTFGSVRYMAPELFGADPVDGRADIYSLGIIAYELFAGRDAFEKAFRIVLRDTRNQAIRWMKWHTNLRVKAPSLIRINEQVPTMISDLVARMMEKVPHQRIESAMQLLETIRNHVDQGHSITADLSVGPVRPQTATGAASQQDTTMLPKKRKLSLILTVVLGIVIIVSLGLYVRYRGQAAAVLDQQRSYAMERFDEARMQYGQGKYEAAHKRFEQLAKRWKEDIELGPASQANALMALAQIELAGGNYEVARQSIREADKIGILDRDPISDLDQEVIRRAALQKEITLIKSYIDERRFDEARLRGFKNQDVKSTQEEGPWTDKEKEKLKQLGETLADQFAQHQIKIGAKNVRQMAEAGQYENAIALLQRVQQKYPSRQLQELRDQIERDKAYETAIADGKQAELKSDLKAAITAYAAALELNQDEVLLHKMNQLRSRDATDDGRRFLNEGDVEAAEQAFARALGFADNEGARLGLARIASADQRETFMRAGDNALAKGDYDRAIRQYQNALDLINDVAIADKLRSAKVLRYLTLSRQLRRKGRIGEAEKELAQAESLEPCHPAISNARAEQQKWATYQKLLKTGDDYRRQSRFGDAKREYLQAANVLETDEILQRLDDIEYDHWIAQAQSFMRSKNWDSARACLLSAANHRDTEQLRQLFDEVEENLPDRN